MVIYSPEFVKACEEFNREIRRIVQGIAQAWEKGRQSQ